MAPHSSTLAWQIPWTEEPGRLQSMQSLGIRHDWVTSLSLFTFMQTHSSVLAWRIPGTGEPGGLPSLGSYRVGHDWSNLAAAAAWRLILCINLTGPWDAQIFDQTFLWVCLWRCFWMKLPSEYIDWVKQIALTKTVGLIQSIKVLNQTKVWSPTVVKWASQWCSVKESTCQCRRCQRCWLDPWVGKILWRRAWQPTPVFLPGKFHGPRSLAVYSPRSHKESDMIEFTHRDTHTHTCIHF